MMPYTPVGVESDALARITLANDTVARSGECEHPLWMTGSSLLVEADTGRVLHRSDEPVRVRCRNRRYTVCLACSALYRMDAYHLIAAGLRGGKDTPPEVANRPRLFVTLTAPSFGRVHRGPDEHGTPRRCHPHRKGRNGCGAWHLADDPAVGTPLEPDRYDYTGQVLFNAYAGALWRRFTIEARRALARAAGLSRADAHRQVRVVFAKVAEFQTRGCVHYHAIVRLDGPNGPASHPPAWATTDLLETAIRHAARAVHLASPATPSIAARTMVWGRQLDIQYLPTADDGADLGVARYVAKYTTKAAEAAGISLAAMFCRTCGGEGVLSVYGRDPVLCMTCAGTGRRANVDLSRLSPHGRALVKTCWRLGVVPAFRELRLRRWAHQAGYRGHFTTKSRTYSTTFAALRNERGQYRIAGHATRLGIDAGNGRLINVGHWRYSGNPPSTPEGGGR
jgi:hypothetical protein